MIDRIVVLGGGSAGFIAAISLKTKLPALRITVIRSKELGIIGVGEGTTVSVPNYLHGFLNIYPMEFHRTVNPTFKLGIKFLWGPRPYFNYTFSPQFDMRYAALPGDQRNRSRERTRVDVTLDQLVDALQAIGREADFFGPDHGRRCCHRPHGNGARQENKGNVSRGGVTGSRHISVLATEMIRHSTVRWGEGAECEGSVRGAKVRSGVRRSGPGCEGPVRGAKVRSGVRRISPPSHRRTVRPSHR